MATWADLVGYVESNYQIKDQNEQMMMLGFELGDGRSQNVMVYHASLMDGEEDWIVIESAVGTIDEVNLRAALKHVGDMVCGGLTMVTDTLVGLRHAVPLENLDINEFERPMALVTLSSDHLEEVLVGQDKY